MKSVSVPVGSAAGAISRGRRPVAGAVELVARNAISNVVRVAFPPACAGCGVSGTWMCGDCDAASPRIDLALACRRCGHPHAAEVPSCERCLKWHPALQTCRSVFEHSGPPQRAIHRYKYSNESARAEWCAAEIHRLFAALDGDSPTLVPVPLHVARLRQRGYNQAHLLCTWLSMLGAYTTLDALVRVRRTESQVGLEAEARARNLRDAIAARLPLTGEHVVLVDDVVTTGSTLIAAAIACHRAGAASVRAVTVATGV